MKQLFTAGSLIIAIGAAIIVFAALSAIGHGVREMSVIRLHRTDRRFLDLLMQQGFSWPVLLWAALSLAGVGLVLVGLFNTGPGVEAAGTLLIATAGGWFWFGVMNPALAKSETLKNFAIEAAALVPATARIGHFGLGDCELNYYSPRSLEPVTRISCDEDSLAQTYIIIREEDFEAIPPIRRTCFATELKARPNDSIGTRLLIHRTYP